MPEISYTVAVTFQDDLLTDEWLRWLREGHIADVLAGGATSAEIVALDTPAHAYEIRYRFPSREVFDNYDREHAPRLRAEGLRLFPVEKGVNYRRSLGVILDKFPQPAIEPPVRQCPACDRAFDSILDYPAIRILSVEQLPVPEAIDTLSDAAAQKRLARRRQEPWNRSTPDEAINMTPSIARACATPEVSDYLKRLATLAGQEVKPQILLPPLEPSDYFPWAYPVADTGIYLSLSEADPPVEDKQVAEIQVHCDGPNMGSAGGATLQHLGAVARLQYQGLLIESLR